MIIIIIIIIKNNNVPAPTVCSAGAYNEFQKLDWDSGNANGDNGFWKSWQPWKLLSVCSAYLQVNYSALSELL